MLVRCVVSSLDSAKEGHVSLKVSINPKEVNKVLSSGTLKPGMVSLESLFYIIYCIVYMTQFLLNLLCVIVTRELRSNPLTFQTLSGCVESVEDHGYLVDIGISGTKAFLPKKSIASKQGRINLLFF